MRTRTLLAIALVTQLGAATAGWALTIYFKDGSDELTAARYRVEGSKLIATLQSGQEVALPLADVDLERTEAMNKVAKGSAMVLDRIEGGPDAPPERTLADLMSQRPRSQASNEASEETSKAVRRTPAGNVDFFKLPHRPLAGERATEILTLLRETGLRDVEVFQGTAGDRVLVDVTTAARSDVFSALERCAAALGAVQERYSDVAAFEVAMSTATRSRAGQFVLTAADAERLRNGEVTPAEHFMAKVLF
jgi:hypothetical protein